MPSKEASQPWRGVRPSRPAGALAQGSNQPSLKKLLNESGRQRSSAYTSPKNDSWTVSNNPHASQDGSCCLSTSLPKDGTGSSGSEKSGFCSGSSASMLDVRSPAENGLGSSGP